MFRMRGKSMTKDKNDEAWAKADSLYEKADDAALLACRASLPPGRMVKWHHGRYERMGEVVEVIGFAYDHARVRVKSIVSGKQMDVCAAEILRHL